MIDTSSISIPTGKSAPAPAAASAAGAAPEMAGLFTAELLAALALPEASLPGTEAAVPAGGKPVPDSGKPLPEDSIPAASTAEMPVPVALPLPVALPVPVKVPAPASRDLAATRLPGASDSAAHPPASGKPAAVPAQSQTTQMQANLPAAEGPASTARTMAPAPVPQGDVQLVFAKPDLSPAAASLRQSGFAPAALLAPSPAPAQAPGSNPILPNPAAQVAPDSQMDPAADRPAAMALDPARAKLAAPDRGHGGAEDLPAPQVAEKFAASIASTAQNHSATPLHTALAAAPVTGPAATGGPAPAVTAPPQAPNSAPDFAEVVARLVEARESAQPGAVRLSVANADFGTINLRLEPLAAGLAVSMTSADPEFASAARNAMAEKFVAAAPEAARADTGGGRSEQGGAGGNQQSGSSGHPFQQGQHGAGAHPSPGRPFAAEPARQPGSIGDVPEATDAPAAAGRTHERASRLGGMFV